MIEIKSEDFISHIGDYLNYTLQVRNAQESGVKAKATDLSVFCQFIEKYEVETISGPQLLEFMSYLTLERNNSPGAANRKVSTLRNYFNYLYFFQVNGAEPLQSSKILKVNAPYPGQLETLTPAEVRRLLDTADLQSANGLRDFVVYSLMYRLGMRVGEIHALNMDSVDFERSVLTVNGKGRKVRRLALVSDLPELLMKWLQVRHKHFRGGGDALFLSQKGNRLSIRTIQDNFKNLVEKAGPFSIEKVTPHTLRHAFASHALESGADLVVLKAVMGHARLTSTEIYLHPSAKSQREAVDNHLSNDLLADMTGSFAILRQQQKLKAG